MQLYKKQIERSKN